MSRRTRVFVFLIALCLSGGSVFGDGSLYMDPLYGVSSQLDVFYGQGNTNYGPLDLYLNVYQPTDIGLAPVLNNRPLVVIQDGGAWTSGDKDAGRVVTPAMYLAQRGYTTITADYRQVENSPIVGPGAWNNLDIGFPVNIYPGAYVIKSGVEDFARAISWARSNAGSLGIDTNRVGVAGGSAGGVNALLLQYNNNPVPSSYAAQAVVALVSTMYDNYNRIQAGGPPVFLLNNVNDPLIWYTPQVANMITRFNQVGIYNEPWQQDPELNHDVDYDFHPFIPGVDESRSKDVLERMRDFLANHLAGGPVPISNQIMSVASTDNSRFVKFDVLGNGVTVSNSPPVITPLDVAHDSSNNRYVVDAALSRILKYDGNGNATVFADQSDGLLLPTSIAISGSGDVYAANYLFNQILKINPAGNATVFATTGLETPFGLALDNSGNLFVAELESQKVVKVDSSGNVTLFADSSDGLITPIAVAFDAAGYLYVADAALHKIFKFDSLGNSTVFADAADGLLFPTGLAFDDDGNLFVSKYLSDEILKFNPAGVGTLYANAADGIDGPFGLDLLGYANVSFESLAPQLAAVPEASGLVLTGLAALGALVPLARKGRTRR